MLYDSFFHISFRHIANMFGVRCCYGNVIYSRDKPPMLMFFWSICSFDQLKRELVRWLDGKIPKGEKLEVLRDSVVYLVGCESKLIRMLGK